MLEQKKARIDAMREATEKIGALIARNKLLGERKHISFPFLIVQPSVSTETRIDVTMQSDLKRLSIKSNNALEVVSELQSLSLLEAGSEKKPIRPDTCSLQSGKNLSK